MAQTTPLDSVVRSLKRALSKSGSSTLADRDLLHRFATQNDQEAFAELVRRHGPLVLGTCRRVLRHDHDADDAFQATFLVLARRAGQIPWRESIASWLHEVAHRTALKVRGTRLRRQNREASAVPEPATPTEPSTSQVTDIIDEELRRLPRVYGQTLLLCCLEEKSLAEAAAELGVSTGTIRARLWRGREMLRQRLAGRGVTLPTTLLGMLAGVPAALADSTVESACLFLVEPTKSQTSFPLAQEMLHTMYLAKVKSVVQMVTLTAVSLAMLATGAGFWLRDARAELPTGDTQRPLPVVAASDPAGPENEPRDAKKPVILDGSIKSIDAARNTIVVFCEIDDQDRDVTFAVDAAATIRIAGEVATLDKLQPTMLARLELSADKTTVKHLEARWQPLRAALRGVNEAKGTVTVEIEGQNEQKSDLEVPIRSGGKIEIDGLAVSIAELPVGKPVTLEWSADRKSLVRIESEGTSDDVPGIVQGVDSKRNQICVKVEVNGFRNERKIDLCFDLAKEVKVRLEGKAITLQELTEGMRVRLLLDRDRKTVTTISAAPPSKNRDDDD